MQRLLSILLIFLLLLGLLAGCADKPQGVSSTPAESFTASEEPVDSEPEDSELNSEEEESTTTEDEDDITTTEDEDEDDTTTKKSDKTTSKTDRKTTTKRRTTKKTTTNDEDKNNSTTTENTTTATEAPITERDGLANTKYLLTQKKKLTVGYIGGSITNGTGAGSSDKLRDQNSWRGLTNAWLRETYPDAEITDINAAVGATGSYYAKNRIDYDLLDKNPDLVFIEFVVNDQIENRSNIASRANMETMVRKCWESNPNMDIVFVYTTTVALGGEINRWMSTFESVAQHYGIESIDLGAALKNSGKTLESLFSIADKVHPNIKGYAVMGEEMAKRLGEMLQNADNPSSLKKHTIPAAMTDGLNIHTKTYRATDIQKQNPTLSIGEPLKDWVPHEHIVMKKGDTLTFTFKGESVGFFFYCTDTVQTKVVATLDTGETYSRQLYIRSNTIIDEAFYSLDKDEEHTVTLSYTGDKELLIPFIFTTV